MDLLLYRRKEELLSKQIEAAVELELSEYITLILYDVLSVSMAT